MKAIRKRIFDTDPYEGFDSSWAEPDLQGWGHDHEIFERCIAELKPRVIVEVGSWKGASAIHMAQKCRELDLDPEIICIDTWLGPPNLYQTGASKLQPYMLESMRLMHGYPMLYYTFLRNVVDAGMQDIITPLPQVPENGSKTLRFHEVTADLICIDGPSAKSQLYRDMLYFWPILRAGGYLIGKNADHLEVGLALKRFTAKTGVEPEILGGRFRFTKP